MNVVPALAFLSVFSAVAFLVDVMARDHWHYSQKATWRTYLFAGACCGFGTIAILIGANQ